MGAFASKNIAVEIDIDGVKVYVKKPSMTYIEEKFGEIKSDDNPDGKPALKVCIEIVLHAIKKADDSSDITFEELDEFFTFDKQELLFNTLDKIGVDAFKKKLEMKKMRDSFNQNIPSINTPNSKISSMEQLS